MGLQRERVVLPVWPAHVISRDVPQEKRVSRDPLQLDRTGGKRKECLPDLPEILNKRRNGGEDTVVRTERESDRRKTEMADLLVLQRPARACGMAQASAEKLEHTGPAEKEKVTSVPQREQLTLPTGKGTKPSVQSTRS